MKTEIISSGFGGQGALTIGKFLAKAGMGDGLNVSWQIGRASCRERV